MPTSQKIAANAEEDDRRARTNCFTRLAIATREKLELATLAVYLESTAGWSIETLRAATDQLTKKSPWFPKVAEVNTACQEAANKLRQIREAQRLVARSQAPPNCVSEERHRELMAKLRECIRAHTFGKDW